MLGACAHTSPNQHGKLWAGSNNDDGIKRAQENKVIKCADPDFKDFVCERVEDYTAYSKACKDWY